MAIVTKIDKVPRDRVAAQLVAVSELVGHDTEIVPVSATTGDNVDVLIDVLAAQLPPARRSTPTASSPTSPKRC